jgi:alpha-beta hydrolase superfamily lysophospholipase
MSAEKALWIDGPSGRLFAILHSPSSQRQRDACILMLNSGQVSRAGPHRLYVRAARRWAAEGFMVLRADLAGIGDSQAENPVIHFDNHSTAEVDALIDYIQQTFRPRKIFVQGLCAGARVAIKAAASNANVAGVLAWSCPIFSGGARMPRSPDTDRKEVERTRDQLTRVRLLLSIREGHFLTGAWWAKRFRNFGEDLRRVAWALRPHGRRRKPQRGSFLEAAHAYVDGGRSALFVFGARDRIVLSEFREQFAALRETTDTAAGFVVIPQGTHTLSSVEAQESAIELCASWLIRLAS